MLLRTPTPDDLDAVLAVCIARDVADIGVPDFTRDDLLEEWSSPEMDLGRDAFVVEDADGAIVGYAAVDPRGAQVMVHPQAEGRGAGTALREAVEARQRERGEPVRQALVAANAGGVEHLRAAGYQCSHVYQRMEALLGAVPPLPPELASHVRPFDLDTEGEAIHDLIETAFTEIPGNVGMSFEAWNASISARSEPRFRLAADLDGSLAGAAIGYPWEDGTGYVAYIATSRAARGRGLGRALLLALLHEFRAAGFTRAELSVHGTNAPATGLYESAGMRPSWRAERWDRE